MTRAEFVLVFRSNGNGSFAEISKFVLLHFCFRRHVAILSLSLLNDEFRAQSAFV